MISKQLADFRKCMPIPTVLWMHPFSKISEWIQLGFPWERNEWELGLPESGLLEPKLKASHLWGKGEGCEHSSRDGMGEQKLHTHLSDTGRQWRAQRGEQDACLKWRGTSVYLQKCHLGLPLAKSGQQFGSAAAWKSVLTTGCHFLTTFCVKWLFFTWYKCFPMVQIL